MRFYENIGLSVSFFFLSVFSFCFVLFSVFFETPRLRSQKHFLRARSFLSTLESSRKSMLAIEVLRYLYRTCKVREHSWVAVCFLHAKR